MDFRILNKFLIISLAILVHSAIFAIISDTVIVGNYVQPPGATLQNEISASGATDRLLVSGTATITGSNVQIIPEPGVYLKGINYTFLTAQAGVIGQFAQLIQPGNFDGELFYFPNNVSYLLQSNVVGGFIGNICGNAGRIRSLLGDLIIEPNSDLFTVLEALSNLDPTEDALKHALDEISPARYGTLPWINAAIFSLVRTQLSLRNRVILNEECICETNGFWLSGVGEILQQEKINELVGFHACTRGFIGGYDKRIADIFSIGISGGYTHTDLHWKPSRGHNKIDSYFGSLYSFFPYQCWLFDLSLTGVWQRHRSKRTIHFPEIHRIAASSYDGNGFIAHVGTAYDWQYCNFDVSPYFGVDYYCTKIDSIHECGAGDLNFRIKKQHGYFIRTELGIGFQTEKCACFGIFIPYLDVSWVFLTPLHKGCITSNLVCRREELGLRTTDHALNFLAPSIGCRFRMCDTVEFGAGYKGEFSKERQDHDFYVNLALLF